MSKENVNLSTLLLESRILFIGSEINPEMANAIVSALLYLDSVSHEPIRLYINSGGGAVCAGYAIIDTMRMIESPVETVCVGMAASMAAVILACGEPGCRQGWSSRLSLQALRPSSMARREQERRRRFISWPRPAEVM